MKNSLISRCLGLIAGLLLVSVSGVAVAGEGEGTIGNWFTAHAGSPGNYAFHLESRTGAPACAATGRFVTNSKELMTLVLAAKLAGKKVKALGTGLCDIWGDSETVWAIQIIDQ